MGQPIKVDFLNDLKSGCLKPILDLVKKDDTLELELRGDQVTIYYRGRNVLDIKRASHSYDFDSFYTPFKKSKIITKSDFKDVVNDFCKAKHEIDISRKPNPENGFSQLIKRDNNKDPQSDYVITDMEDTIDVLSDNNAKPDLIAFKFKGRERTEAILTLIETKFNNGAISGPNGIQKHVGDFVSLLSSSKGTYINKHKEILKQKIELGLIKKRGLLYQNVGNVNVNKIEMLLVLANFCPRHNGTANVFDKEIKVIMKKGYNEEYLKNVYIAEANFMGTGLYFWEDKDFKQRRIPNILEYPDYIDIIRKIKKLSFK